MSSVIGRSGDASEISLQSHGGNDESVMRKIYVLAIRVVCSGLNELSDFCCFRATTYFLHDFQLFLNHDVMTFKIMS
jgi:hypothetical protein